GNKAADNAAQIIEALKPLSETLNAQHRDSTAMLEEARKAADEQRAATSEQIESLKQAVEETLSTVSAETEAARNELVKTVEGSFGELGKAQDEAFDDIKAKTLKEHERTRDELQTDILGFKNATSARLDSLEAEVTKAQNAIKELEGKITESTDAVSKKLFVPICAAIGLGAIDLICLVMLLMR
ncbi:MAG: hypothetical protein PUH18_04325, partial [Coriobacteriaceae bacterium]|nr:hypothetical protein [Coriobacteriaceae bacterium]